MNIGVDAAALGMSNAVTGFTNDVNSGYWNPTGLLNLEDKQFALMHANYYANIAQYDYVGFAMPIDDRSAVGLSLIRFGVDDILNTTQLIDSEGNIDYNRISFCYRAYVQFSIGICFGSFNCCPSNSDWISHITAYSPHYIGGQLRFYDAGKYTSKCYCFFFREGYYCTNGARRNYLKYCRNSCSLGVLLFLFYIKKAPQLRRHINFGMNIKTLALKYSL